MSGKWETNIEIDLKLFQAHKKGLFLHSAVITNGRGI